MKKFKNKDQVTYADYMRKLHNIRVVYTERPDEDFKLTNLGFRDTDNTIHKAELFFDERRSFAHELSFPKGYANINHIKDCLLDCIGHKLMNHFKACDYAMGITIEVGCSLKEFERFDSKMEEKS